MNPTPSTSPAGAARAAGSRLLPLSFCLALFAGLLSGR